MASAGNWVWHQDLNKLCQVLETQTLWGETVCRVWLPGSNSIIHIPAVKLKPLSSAPTGSPDYIAYAASAARIADALTQDVLLAPIESSVIPLPHQVRALSRAISEDRVRYLLADEVGLGKTIEAGLIMRELKLRGKVARTLVVAPKGLVNQWVSEMLFHFGETFKPLLPEDIRTLKRLNPANPWQMFPQAVVSMDSVKPMEKRRGWAPEQVMEYNQERFEDLMSAGWDMVIVDEAHRLGGSTDQVARFKLGQGLSEAAPCLLLLSATPHQGKTDAFHRLVSLIDPRNFPDVESVTRDRVAPVVIRTEKRKAIDAEGKPLFKPRRTQLIPVSWEPRHREQQLLYEAVTEYVREGYNLARRDKRSFIGFLMILLQRLVVSSTRAIRTTLERRLEALAAPEEQLMLFPFLSDEEWADLDGQEQTDMAINVRAIARGNERVEVRLLLETAARCEQTASDAKAEALLEWLYRLQAEEGDSDLKVLVFTEFVPTQEMLAQFLEERGFSVVRLNGSMDMEERKKAQESFAVDIRILISTDAGGEGLNLQFCHVVINYDIPWNPMRLEQRIGRVDRIGQTHTVRAVNFLFEDSVEYRVRQVLEEKLAVIFEDFGIDKTGDVLDSAQAGRLFDEMYVESIVKPETIEQTVDTAVTQLREQIRNARSIVSILGTPEDLNPADAARFLKHPFPHWLERMTVHYLKAHAGKAERKGKTWNLQWSDGETISNAVFSSKDAELVPSAIYITLEDEKIRNLASHLPRFVPGQHIPVVSIPGVVQEITGFWSLWRIAVMSVNEEETHANWKLARIVPLFLADDGRVLQPTARHVWEILLSEHMLTVSSLMKEDESAQAFARLGKTAGEQGQPIFEALVRERQARLNRDGEKDAYSFAARRKAIDRIGLPQVRNHRLAALEREEKRHLEELERQKDMVPEMFPIIILRVTGDL